MDPRQTGWIGAIIGNRWRIDSRIARGGVATVFKATERGGPNVAVKIMHPEFSRNMDARGRFLREGYAANKVGHPCVVKVLHDGTDGDNTVYLVMELLDDGELLETKRERLGGKLSADEVANIADQLLDVCASAHEKGIIHRDIKPENLYLLGDGTLKVLDFGIAHLKEAAARSEPTATGLLLGTPDFMSPEQAQGTKGAIDVQTDIYAVGATMFTLLSGEAVHVEQALGTLLHATASKQARSLRATRVGAAGQLPEELIAVVDRALMLHKEQRWQTARAMREALMKAMPPQRTQMLRPIKVPPQVPRASAAPPAPPKAIALAPKAPKPQRPVMDEPKPPSDRTVVQNPDYDPWTKPFADGEMEGSTVALGAPPPKTAAPAPVDAQGETQAIDAALLPRAPSMAPPPMSLAPATPPMHQLPQPTAPMHPNPNPNPNPNAYASGPQLVANTPRAVSLPPPAPYPQPYAPPPTPRGQQWGLDSASVAVAQPKMVPQEAPRKKPPSILIAEILLAALVVVTLTIGGCLLLRG